MENSEEILHSLEQFSKFKPKDIPRELEEYLCFVAKTGDPIYQWASIKNLLKEKLINVVNEFYETCPLGDIPPCPNVEIFNYDNMKLFILEKLEAFSAAPFTVQRICELLTTPRREYNRIDKFMRALEKNILVVSTVEPGFKNAENGEITLNGLESEHFGESTNCGAEVNVEMEENSLCNKKNQKAMECQNTKEVVIQETPVSDIKESEEGSTLHKEIEEDNKDESKSKNTSAMSTSDQIINDTLDEININSSTTQTEEQTHDTCSLPEKVYEVAESEPVSSACSEQIDENKEDIKNEEITPPHIENLKQADSTTNSTSPTDEEISTVESNTTLLNSELVETEQNFEISIDVPHSISNQNINVNEDSKLSSHSPEVDVSQDVPENETEIDSNEAKKVLYENDDSVSYDEDSSNSASSADTINNEGQLTNQFEEKMVENKEEKITSSDKIVLTLPNTSIDDINHDESEVVEEAVSQNPEERVGEASQDSNNLEDVVTASTDELKNDCQEYPMEVDSKEKGDSNEVETTCDSI